MARTSSLAWFLLGLCLSRPALAVEPTSIPRATTQQVHQTVDRAVGYMQTESAAWLNTRKCAACHHVPMPLCDSLNDDPLSAAQFHNQSVEVRALEPCRLHWVRVIRDPM